MRTILVLGGYGGFGAILSRHFAAAGYKVLVAGRSLARAQDYCLEVAGTEAIEADRNGDLDSLLERHRPDLLVDAAGPFQTSGYQVVQSCIRARISYVDLADATDFVVGVSEFHDDALKAGIRVVSGASSVPALSGAAAEALTRTWDQVTAIDIAITASNRASLGRSVITAILSYVGRPVRLWRGRRWVASPGWSHLKRMRFELPGHAPLSRLVALADVPDLVLLPGVLRGAPAVMFRAGPEFAFQTFALWLLSFLPRSGLLVSLRPLAGILENLRKVFGRVAGSRSAMAVSACGFTGEDMMKARWTLIAEDGHGPEIPTFAARIAAERILSGSLAPGAMPCVSLISLDEFRPYFRSLSIHEGITETVTAPLYRRLLGHRFDVLPEAVREMHQICGNDGAEGHAKVLRGRNPVTMLIGRVVNLPPAGEHSLHVEFDELDGAERWTRSFGKWSFSSHLSEDRAFLVERIGPLGFHFELMTEATGLEMLLRRCSFGSLPIPLKLAPRCFGREWQEGENFCFHASVHLPLIGRVVEYSGKLRKIRKAPPPPSHQP